MELQRQPPTTENVCVREGGGGLCPNQGPGRTVRGGQWWREDSGDGGGQWEEVSGQTDCFPEKAFCVETQN